MNRTLWCAGMCDHLCLAAAAAAAAAASGSPRTPKPAPLTFPFVCLAAQFERVANIYFLLISVLMLVGTYFPAFFVSPLTPFSTFGPLCLVLSLTMAKEWVEDSARHRADAEMNARPTRIVRLGSDAGAGASARHEVEVRPWRDVQVGDVVEIHDREMLPADRPQGSPSRRWPGPPRRSRAGGVSRSRPSSA